MFEQVYKLVAEWRLMHAFALYYNFLLLVSITKSNMATRSGSHAFKLIPDVKTVAVSLIILSQVKVYCNDSLTSGHRVCFRV